MRPFKTPLVATAVRHGPIEESLASWYSSEVVPGLVSGTEDNLALINSAPAFGSLGGNFSQAVPGKHPSRVTTRDRMSAHFFEASLVSGFAAAVWAFMHDGTPTTLTWRGRPMVVNTEQTIFSTQLTATGRGYAVSITASGAVRVVVGDGTLIDECLTSGGVVVARTSYTIDVRFSTAHSHKIEIIVNGSLEGSISSLTISPSASDPGSPARLGIRSTTFEPFNGFYGELLVYDRYLSDTELTINQSYIGRWSLKWTLAELKHPVLGARMGPTVFLDSTGGAWTDAVNGVAVTEVGSPVHVASAAFGGASVMRLDGATQYAHFNSIAGDFAGSDVPITVISAVQMDAVASTQTLFSLGDAAGTEYHRNESTSTPEWQLVRFDGIGIDSHLVGTPTTEPTIIGMSFYPDDGGADVATVYENDARLSNAAAMGSGTVSPLSLAQTGARAGAAPSVYLDGDFAAQIIIPRGLSYGDYRLIWDALDSAYFG